MAVQGTGITFLILNSLIKANCIHKGEAICFGKKRKK